MDDPYGLPYILDEFVIVEVTDFPSSVYAPI